jgi:large conductance mechanosensitive channel
MSKIEEVSLQNFPGHVASPSMLFHGQGKGWMQDFREFALRGSMLDMAIGIILGVAFGKIITSFVEDILMPPIGLIFGHGDGSSLFINLSGQPYTSLAAAKAAGAATINYGLFLNSVFNFAIVAFGVFLFVRQINRLRHALMSSEPATKVCPYCCSVIASKAIRCGACTSNLETTATAASTH